MSRRALALSALVALLREHGLVRAVVGEGDPRIGGASHDSRALEPGDLFLAWAGSATDAHRFVGAAVAAGAPAAVVERAVEAVEVPQVVVTDGRRAAAFVADALHGHPSRSLRLAAVTGTNGKTTTALLLRHLLAGHTPAAAVGTLGVIGPDATPRGGGALTTPGPVEIARTLRALADEGVEWVVMEASSHALDQHRLDALELDLAIFTNLSLDHLDYHETFSRYRDAKLRLVELLGVEGRVIVNAAEPAWGRIELTRLVRYGVDTAADVVADEVTSHPGGSRFRLRAGTWSTHAEVPLPGRFNVENAVAALAAAVTAGVPLDMAVARLATAPQVPGRMEVVVRGADSAIHIIIDFAHTPDALENLLLTARTLTPATLRVLFGAGGDRDPSKREPMARAVARHADRIWLTSDNPRTEDPDAILDDLEVGMGGADYRREPDRAAAIRGVVAEAEAGDVIVLAGKGHELWQVVGSERRPFDERVIVHEALAARGAA